MSELKSLLTSLSTKYNDSPDILMLTLENIYKQIKSLKCSKKKSISVISVFASICANLEKANEEKFKISSKFINRFVPLLEYDVLHRGLNYVKIFIHYSFTQNKIAEIRNFFINFEIQPSDMEDSLKFYFDINKIYYSRIIFCHQPTIIEVRKFFGNLSKIFQATQNLYPAQFLEFSELIFGQQHYIRLIFTYLKESKDFLKAYMNILSAIQNIMNLNNLYIHLTKIFIYFLQIESSKEFATSFSKSLLEACLKNEEIKHNKYITDILSIYYYFIILLNDEDREQQVKFKKVLEKYKLFLERNDINENCFEDAFITFIEEMYTLSKDLSKNTTEYNCELVFDILETLLKYVNQIKYSKNICPQCSYHTHHQLYNLCGISVNFYHRAIKLNLLNENIDKFNLNIFKISLDLKNEFNCKLSNKLLFNLVSNFFKCMKDINTVERSRYGLALLDLIANSSDLESVGRVNILKLYKKFYEIIQDRQNLLITQALFILNLNADEKYYNYISSELVVFIKYLIDTKNTPDTLICDVIPDTKYNFKPKISNISYILQQQIEISREKKLLNPEELENLVLKSIDQINSNLEFALLVRNVNIITDKILLEKVNNVIRTITNNLNDDRYMFENHYALGILYKRDAMQLFEELKKIISRKKITYDTLENLINIQLDEFNVNVENKAINIAISSIQHFSCILPHLTNEDFSRLINWMNLFDDVSMLARQLESRGYINHGYKAWKFLYNISTDNHICYWQQMRALSYFCKHIEIINVLDKSLNIESVINTLCKQILISFKNIDSLTPRKQNYVLFCILDLVYFYAEKNDIKSCNALMNMVANKLNQMASRKHYFELVRARLCALEFHLVTKFQIVLKRSPYSFIESLLNEVKNIHHITSEDSIATINFLLYFIEEVVYFLMSMNDADTVKLFVMMISKYSLNAGFIFRFVQFFLLGAHINLEVEELHACQIKLLIVNKLMLIENDLKMENSAKENHNNVLPQLFDKKLKLIECLTRKISDNTSSPKLSISLSKYSLLGYLNNHYSHCACEFCKNPAFKMIQFKMGCLYARLHYLNGETMVSEEFFEKSLNWWNELKYDYDKSICESFHIWMMIYYINTLRSNRKFCKANEICQFALVCIKESHKKIDLGCYWKIIEQKEAINYSISKMSTLNILEKTKSNLKQPMLDSQLENTVKDVKSLFNDNQIITTIDLSESYKLESEQDIVNLKKLHTEDLKKLNTFRTRKQHRSHVLLDKNETTLNTTPNKQIKNYHKANYRKAKENEII